MNSIIFDYFDELIPNPVCELNYTSDYQLLIAVMLSAQTTDKRLNEVTKVLFEKYLNLEELSVANIDDIIEIIKPLGTYHKKAQNIINISKKLLLYSDGVVPNNREFLESLDGVGRKTTNVVLSILYNMPFIAVDTHVSRVSKRLGFANENDSVLEIENKLYKLVPLDRMNKIHHQLLLFGRYHCKALKPMCKDCKLKKICKEKKELF